MKNSVQKETVRATCRRWGTHGTLVFALVLLGFTFPAQAQLGGAWTEQGPGPITGGQVEGITGGHVVGAVETVAAHPTDADTLYIGSVNGGIWKTTNATAAPSATAPSWTAQTDAQTSLSISALEFDPADATNNTLWAGIGRTRAFGGVGGSRSGLLRTTNGGTTWTLVTTGLAGPNITGVVARGTRIVISVDIADTFSFPNLGIFRSIDTGASFTQISTGDGMATGLPRGLSHDLANNPNTTGADTTQLFTSILFWDDIAPPGVNGIYRSNDTGAAWTKVSDAAIDALLVDNVTSEVQIAVGKASTNLTTANVFVAICGVAGTLTGLFHSANAGGTWTALDNPQTTLPVATPIGIHPGVQCSVHLSLAADPTDHSVVYIGGDRQPSSFEEGTGAPQFPNSVGADNFTGRLFKVDADLVSPDQDLLLTHCMTTTPASCPTVSTASDTSPHADSREMVFDADNNLIEVDDGGVYQRTNPNGTTGDWFSLNGDLMVNEQHDTAIGSLISGNQDVGSTEQTTLGTDSWSTVVAPGPCSLTQQGDGGDVAIAKGDPPADPACPAGTGPCTTRYSSTQDLGFFIRRVFDSTPALVSCAVPGLAPGGDPAIDPQFVTPIEINGGDPTRLILGGEDTPAMVATGVYESMNRGDTISRVSTSVINAGGRNAIAYGTAGNNDALYFGTGDEIHVRTMAPPTAPTVTNPDAGNTTDLIADIGPRSRRRDGHDRVRDQPQSGLSHHRWRDGLDQHNQHAVHQFHPRDAAIVGVPHVRVGRWHRRRYG